MASPTCLKILKFLVVWSSFFGAIPYKWNHETGFTLSMSESAWSKLKQIHFISSLLVQFLYFLVRAFLEKKFGTKMGFYMCSLFAVVTNMTLLPLYFSLTKAKLLML